MVSIRIYKDITQGKLKVDEETGKVKISTAHKTLPKRKGERGLLNQAKKKIDAFVNWQLAWDNLMDKLSALDKASKPYESDLSKIGDKVHYARMKNMANLGKTLTMVQIKFVEAYEAVSKRDILKITQKLREEIDLGEFKNSEGSKVKLVLNKEQIIKKVMQLDDPSLELTFKEGMLYTEEIENALRKALSKKDLAWIKGQREVYDYMWKRINPVFEKMYGIHFPHNPFYSGTIRRDIKDLDIPEATLLSQDLMRYQSILNPSLKTRSKTLQSLVYDEATNSLMNYVMQMEHFVNWAETLQDLRRTFGDKRIKTVIRELYGQDILTKINGFLDDMTRDGVDRAKVIAPLDSIRFNFARSVLTKPLKGVIMIQKIWEDLFNSSEAEGLSIASKEDVEQIIGILIADKIDPQAFLSNLETLLLGGMPSINDFFEVREKKEHKPTESVSHFTFIENRPPGMPLWFLAAYPDIMVWLTKQEKKYIKSHNRDYDGWGVKMSKLFGIKIEDGQLNENQIMDSKGKTRPKYLKNLVQSYKDVTEKALETAVKNIENDVYLGDEILKVFGSENNCTFIAENTTKFYLELSRNYAGRFNDESSLLATAGILDARFYIFIQKIINPMEILSIAKKPSEAGKESLINFIIDLEVKLFKVDEPNMNLNDIKDVCEEQRQNIEKAIQKVKDEYTSEPRFASEVAAFMNSTTFKPYRKMLGIKNKFLFF
jgi:hypothetical protein